MAYPYDRRSPRYKTSRQGSGHEQQGQVPLRVAQQWAEEHRRLLTQIQELQRDNRLLERENRILEGRLDEAEAKLEEETEALTSEEDARRISRLSRRVEELTGDLERVQRKSGEAVHAARADEQRRIVASFGDVLDSVDRALDGQAEGPWRAGLEAIRAQFLTILKNEGVVLVGQIGDILDPNLHQAIGLIDTDAVEAGRIARVDRPGLLLADGAVARPALVTVAR